METPKKQPPAELAELHAKVIELSETVQAKKEDLRKKQQEDKVATEKKEREIYLDNIYSQGKELATRVQGTYGCNTIINISGFKEKLIVASTENYITWLKDAFMELQNQFTTKKKLIYDPRKERKTIWHPPISDRSKMDDEEPKGRTCGNEGLPRPPLCFKDQPGYDEVVELKGDELNNLRKIQKKELEQLTEEIAALARSLHAHMQGFIDAMLKSDRHILDAVKVAMIAGVDAFHKFDGRQKVLERFKTTVIDKIGEKLSTKDLNEAGIGDIERILNEVNEAIGQQIKK